MAFQLSRGNVLATRRCRRSDYCDTLDCIRLAQSMFVLSGKKLAIDNVGYFAPAVNVVCHVQNAQPTCVLANPAGPRTGGN